MKLQQTPNLSSPPAKQYLNQRALVMGASIAGMLAARVLADYFESVTLVDRDSLAEGSVARKGVPQGKHNHVLMIRGQQSLERFFPDFADQLNQAGAPTLRWLTDIKLYLSNGWLKRDDLNIITRTTTRPALESIIRQSLKKLPNVCFLENCQVDGLAVDSSGQHVIGLNVSYRRGADDAVLKADRLEADLIVDASGRNSKVPDWLKMLGYEPPAETRVNPRLGYSSRFYSKLSYEPDWKFMGLNAKAPDQPRGGSISLHEGGQWLVTLMGYGEGHQPPTDPDEFLAFAKSLPSHEMYEALKGATPLSDAAGYANTMNIWRHYEHLKRMPEGLLVLGDAVCCFNPIYGQGMTTAALAAESLDRCLAQKRSSENAGVDFQKRLAKVIANPWLLATGADFQFPETEGQRPGGFSGLAQGYFDRLLQKTYDDPQVASDFIKVLNMVKSPISLFSPSLLLKVLQPPKNPNPGSPAAATSAQTENTI